MPAAFAAAIIVGLPAVSWGRLAACSAFCRHMPAEEGFDAGGAGFFLLALLRDLPPFAASRAAAPMRSPPLLSWRRSAPRCRSPRDTRHSPFAAAAVLATVFMVVVSPHYPWYFSWLIVFACFVRSLALLWLTNACLLLYLVPVGSQIVRERSPAGDRSSGLRAVCGAGAGRSLVSSPRRQTEP